MRNQRNAEIMLECSAWLACAMAIYSVGVLIFV